MAVLVNTPSAPHAFTSAWMPAPPPLSEPAMASTQGTCISFGMGGVVSITLRVMGREFCVVSGVNLCFATLLSGTEMARHGKHMGAGQVRQELGALGLFLRDSCAVYILLSDPAIASMQGIA